VQLTVSSVDVLFALLVFLTIKHTVVDFFLQTNYQISNKRYYGSWGSVSHSLQHGIGTVLCVYAVTQNWGWAASAGLADAVLHYHIDYTKIKFTPTDSHHPHYWRWFGVDQALHYLTYLAIGITLAKL